MRAIVLERVGGLDKLVCRDIPEPEPMAGHVVIQVKAFGVNHAEMHSHFDLRSNLAIFRSRCQSSTS